MDLQLTTTSLLYGLYEVGHNMTEPNSRPICFLIGTCAAVPRFHHAYHTYLREPRTSFFLIIINIILNFRLLPYGCPLVVYSLPPYPVAVFRPILSLSFPSNIRIMSEYHGYVYNSIGSVRFTVYLYILYRSYPNLSVRHYIPRLVFKWRT